MWAPAWRDRKRPGNARAAGSPSIFMKCAQCARPPHTRLAISPSLSVQFPEIQEREYCSLAAERRNAAGGIFAVEIARQCGVPAGHALAVDRAAFAAKVTEIISREPLIAVRREEVTAITQEEITIIATGPPDFGCTGRGDCATE